MAFDIFYKRYVSELVNFAEKKTYCRETAKELVQDTFLDFFQKRDLLKPENSVKAYLYTILKHKVYNHYRQNKVALRHQPFIQHHQLQSANVTEAQINDKELHNLLQQNIDRLPQKCREVFRLSRFEQLPQKEIALRLNISVNTVEQHMRKAIGKLRTSLHHLF